MHANEHLRQNFFCYLCLAQDGYANFFNKLSDEYESLTTNRTNR